MTKIASFFNNKGGVGKTTLLYHVAHVLAEDGYSVLMVDADSQCNLTAYTLSEKQIEKAWEEGGNSIWRAIELVARTIGDIRNRAPTIVRDNLSIIPGDLLLSVFEDLLGETWNSAKGGSEAALRAQSALYRVVLAAGKLGLAMWQRERVAAVPSGIRLVPLLPPLHEFAPKILRSANGKEIGSNRYDKVVTATKHSAI